ncbi:MAG: DegT/DnrJ/EryC1/StrS family aminotransferase [Ruthenibacterium lactatiformans]
MWGPSRFWLLQLPCGQDDDDLGEGGMFVCSDDQVAHNVPGIRHNGLCAFQGERERYWVPAMSNVDEFLEDRWPQNFCLGEAQCALGSEQLKSVIANNEILIEQDRKIREWLKDVPEITFPGIVEGGRYVVHQYIMHYDGSKYGKNRNDLLDLLTQKYGVRAIVQYYPLYRYPLFQKKGCGAY